MRKKKKIVRFSELSDEMKTQIAEAFNAVANQEAHRVKCPYCTHNSIVIFEDTSGHVQAKCKICGNETVFDALEIKRLLCQFKTMKNNK